MINPEVYLERTPTYPALGPHLSTLAYPSAPMWLVYHDPGVREGVSEVLGSSCQQEGPHAAGLTHTPCGHWRLDILHGVVDTQPSSHRTTCGKSERSLA